MQSPEFERFRHAIYSNLKSANMHYHQYTEMRSAIKSDPLPFRKANHFWSLFLNAHLEATQISLCRLYDQESKAASLRNWLSYIDAHGKDVIAVSSEDMERVNSDSLAKGEFEEHLCGVTASKDAVVKKLVGLRNNLVAHTSRKLDESESLSLFPINVSEYDTLIERAKMILNRYSVLHDGRNYAIQTNQHEDFRVVLRDISNAP